MSNIEKLLKGVEVEWKLLGDVTKYEQPTNYLVKSTNYKNDFPTPVLTAGKTFILGYTNETNGIYKASENPVIIFDDFTTANKWVNFDFKAKSSAMKLITSKDETIVLLRYIYHWLNTLPNGLVDGDHKRQWISNYANKQIPIPCPDDPEKSLEIQKEIVRILDKFSTLTAELQAELQARKSQYEYYRNQLLTYPMEESDQPSLRSSRSASSIQDSDNPTQPLSTPNPHTGNSVLQPRGKVEWKTLGEIGTLKTGRRFVRTDIQECGVPCFHYGDLYTFYGISTTHTKGYLSRELAKKLRFAQTNDIIIVCAGENDMDIGVGVAWLGEEPAVVHDACCILHHNQNPRYISHFLRTHNYHLQIKKYVKNGKISSLPVSGLEKAIIPIPYPNDREKSLKEQERIASILDKFDTITNSISEGLPKEIELRQKQYEYYRDMLLTFPTDNIKV